MAEEDLVPGDGWVSDESSFYGDEEENESQLSHPASVVSHAKDLNVILARARSESTADPRNIWESRLAMWKLNESVDDFLQRLPPCITPSSYSPWIWVGNPHSGTRENLERSEVQRELISRGTDLLKVALQNRNTIRKENSQKPHIVVDRLLDQESENLQTRIAGLATELNFLAGKWMLFPSLDELLSVWRLVVEGTINNRLGTSAKVATYDGSPRNRLICIYTSNFLDTEDVLRVLTELKALGLVEAGREIYYKSDVYTCLNIYGKNASNYGLQASIYNSQRLLANQFSTADGAY